MTYRVSATRRSGMYVELDTDNLQDAQLRADNEVKNGAFSVRILEIKSDGQKKTIEWYDVENHNWVGRQEEFPSPKIGFIHFN